MTVATYNSTEIARKNIGYQTKLNTEFPVVASVRRWQHSASVWWQCLITYDGIGEHDHRERTRREAMEWLAQFEEQGQ